MKKSIFLLSIVLSISCAQSVSAALFITQYYEGTSNNKWIEISNLGATSVALSTYSLSLYSNANAEGYKTGAAANTSTPFSGTLGSGMTILFKNTSAVLPAYASGTTASAVNFNGNDSMVLFNGLVIEDAIGFTNTGNEGVDKSFVRISTAPGFDLVTGSNATSFPAVWQEASLATVEGAAPGTNERLGATTLGAVPEPSAVAILGLGFSVMFLVRRRKR